MKTLNNKTLKVLIIELNNSGTDFGSSDKDIYNLICSYGFNSFNYNPFNRTFTKTTDKTKTRNNTLFLRGDINDFIIRIDKSEKYQINGVTI